MLLTEKIVSIFLLTFVAALDVGTFVLAIKAVQRPHTARITPCDVDGIILCTYDSDYNLLIYLLPASGMLLLSQTLFSAVTHFYFGRGGIRRSCCSNKLAATFFTCSWTCFLFAECFLVGGLVKKSSYDSHFMRPSELYCQTLRKHYLEVGAATTLLSMLFSFLYHWAQPKTTMPRVASVP